MPSSSVSKIRKSLHHRIMYAYLSETGTHIGPCGANIDRAEVKATLYDWATVFSRWSEEGVDAICADGWLIYT